MPRPFLIRLGALALLAACSSDSSTSTPSDGCPNGIGTPSGATITYEVVTVGDADNPADKTGFGSVDHVYGIGKYNVSIGQYAAFLNAVADTDTHGLYHESMGTDLNIAGIARSGGPGTHVYTVVNNGGDSSNRPIAYVTWFAAARFANWMANGQPEGPQGPATTEDGAYALLGATSGPAVARNACNPNTGASVTHWLPTENEWYKAAYYDPTLNGGLGGYHLYATRSSSAPGNVVGSTPNQMNVIVGVNFAVTQDPTLFAGQNYLTDGGAFAGSPSHYGTFDQNGNLYQWNDLDGTPYPYRGVRGSFWFAGAQAAQSIIFAGQTPTHAGNDVGFRLASIAR